MARNKNKLAQVAQEIAEEYPEIQTAVLVYDFAELETMISVIELENKVKEAISGRDVSILVNNVGIMHLGSLEVADV